VAWATEQLADDREKSVFRRMAERAGIAHRWSVLPPTADGGSPIAPGGFYADGMPATAERMKLYGRLAPELAVAAVRDLPDPLDPKNITHLVVASCTGFTAPGLDQIIADRLGLGGGIERTLVGFMGCYGAVTALRTAYHIVRSEPASRVLVIAAELSTLHLQEETGLEALLAMLLFGDGAAAAVVSAKPAGLVMERQFSATLPESQSLIQWHIGDTGFAMHLSGEVPGRIATALAADPFHSAICNGHAPEEIDSWAVHAGGRSILDAVENALALPPRALDNSRAVLREKGNMSSATLMFALQAAMAGSPSANGVAIAFGPGLAAEGFGFKSAG
jgi:predicted naringenin-chalcone synthase